MQVSQIVYMCTGDAWVGSFNFYVSVRPGVRPQLSQVSASDAVYVLCMNVTLECVNINLRTDNDVIMVLTHFHFWIREAIINLWNKMRETCIDVVLTTAEVSAKSESGGTSAPKMDSSLMLVNNINSNKVIPTIFIINFKYTYFLN